MLKRRQRTAALFQEGFANSENSFVHEAGLNDLTLDAICGHVAKTKGQDYTKVTLKKRIEAMAIFPPDKLDESRDLRTSSPL